MTPRELQKRTRRLGVLRSRRSLIDRKTAEIEKEMAADRHLFTPDRIIGDIIEHGTRDDGIRLLAPTLRAWASRIEADDLPASAFDHDPVKLCLAEADRPEGLDLPARIALNAKMRSGLLTVIGAYSGTGKSTFLLNIVRDQLQKGKKSLLFTLEMTPAQLWARLAGIDFCLTASRSLGFWNILQMVKEGDGRIVEFLRRAARLVTVVDASGWNAAQIEAACNRYVDEKGESPALVAVDYLQIIRPSDYGRERRLQVIDTVEAITAAAKTSSAAWILLAQSTRAAHNASNGRAPDLTSFQESASIEQNAALALTLGRQIENEETNEMGSQLEVRAAKNRFGPVGSAWVTIDRPTGAIVDSAPSSSANGQKKPAQTGRAR